MCYHTEIPRQEELREIVPAQIQIYDYHPYRMANGFDHPDMPATVNIEPSAIRPVMWGFLPPSKTKRGDTPTLNARSENLFTNNMWKESARERRCLVYLKGMYEWEWLTPSGSRKQPWYVSRADHRPFVVGGIWKDWIEPDGKELRTFSLVTTPANALMTQVRPHNPRMLLLLDDQESELWMHRNATIDDLNAIMKPYREGVLQASKMDISPLKIVD